MKKLSTILALVVAVCLVLSVSAFADAPTWKDYQDYLVEAAGGNAPDPAEFQAQVAAIGSWDEMPLNQSPWDQLFTTLGISTWDEFVAAGGVGRQSLETGSMAGGASGEASSGEPSGDTSADPDIEQAYKEYLHEWLIAEDEVNDMMTEEIRENEFMPLIWASDYTSFPAEMLWNGMLENGCPMTFEEFAAQYQPPSGEAPSGEAPSAEPAAPAAPVAASYTADYAGWIQYLKDYVSAVPAAQEHLGDFFAAIDAGEFYSFPGDMLFQDTFWGYTAATYDEFIAAGGQVTIPSFDPGMTAD